MPIDCSVTCMHKVSYNEVCKIQVLSHWPLLPLLVLQPLDLNFKILALASKPNYDLSSLTPFIYKLLDDQPKKHGFPGTALAMHQLHLNWLQPCWFVPYIRPKGRIALWGIYRGMKCHVHPGPTR